MDVERNLQGKVDCESGATLATNDYTNYRRVEPLCAPAKRIPNDGI